MIFPDAAARWTGELVVLDWNVSVIAGRPKQRTNSGGRVLRTDDTYLYLQPFALANAVPRISSGRRITRLGFAIDEEQIPLVDIEEIYPAPLEDVEIVE